MAYTDPYNNSSGRQAQQPPYNEPSAPVYNYYSSSQSQPHQAYDHGGSDPNYDPYNYNSGYKDEPQYNGQYPPQRSQTLQTHNNTLGGGLEPTGLHETNIETGGLVPREKKTARTLRNYRYVHQGALWSKGGRGRCFGRVFCCTLMIAVLLFISIILALALWIRPPNITIGDVDTVSKGGSAIQLIDDGVSVNLGVNITVNNPNYFDVNLKQIKAEVFYPLNGKRPQVGEGLSKNIVFQSNRRSNWTFPFTLTYKKSDDPDGSIIQDLASRCGVGGTQKKNVHVNYKISLQIRIIIITVSPVIQNDLDFPCPIDPSLLEPLLKSGLPGL